MKDEPPFSGSEALWQWFGLSYASWLTLPRVLMCQMPDEWQGQMAKLLNEIQEKFYPLELETRVSVVKNKRLTMVPSWIRDYRHPDLEAIAAAVEEARRATP
jgi:hypothetical protein